MLMITVETSAGAVTLRLEGRLAGHEARELARYRRRLAPDLCVSIDLTGLTAVDSEGRDFLARAYQRGDKLIGSTATRAIVADIMASSVPGNGLTDESGTFHGDDFRSAVALFSP